MNLQRILFSVLGGAVMIIGYLLSAWGNDMSTRVTVSEKAIASEEVAEAAHEQELKDIHQDLLRIERLMTKHGAY